MAKARVYKHETKPGKYVVDPPEMFSHLHLRYDGNKPSEYIDRSDARWMLAGGKVIEGYALAIHYATELSLRHQWFEKGKKEGMILS